MPMRALTENQKTARFISVKMESHVKTSKENQSSRQKAIKYYDSSYYDPVDNFEELVDANRFSKTFVPRGSSNKNKKKPLFIFNSASVEVEVYVPTEEEKCVKLFKELPFLTGLYSSEEYDYYCEFEECNMHESYNSHYYDIHDCYNDCDNYYLDSIGRDHYDAYADWLEYHKQDNVDPLPRSAFY